MGIIVMFNNCLAHSLNLRKWHAIHGNAIALFLIDALVEALEDLAAKTYNPAVLMRQLKLEEDLDVASESGLPDALNATMSGIDNGRSPSLCHTGLLPAESRYLGLATGTPHQTGNVNFYKGLEREKVKQQARNASSLAPKTEPRQMKLVFIEAERDHLCPLPTAQDFKDHFFATSRDGWTSVTFPSKAELEYFKSSLGFKPNGVLMLCFRGCDWGNCPEGDIQLDGFKKGKLKLEVNGVEVTDLVQVDQCNLLRHKDGFNFIANNEGQYELLAEVGLWNATRPDILSYTEITSLIVL